VREQIETVIREVLTPLFAAEGGTVELVNVQDSVVQLRFGGAYRGCPSVPFTVASFVTPVLRHAAGSDLRIEVLA
jgi:Fe-S cluster biogenesis protein NfuA